MLRLVLIACSCTLMVESGCSLKEIRSKSTVGPEWRSSGAGGQREHEVRWSGQQGFELKWDRGISTTVTYRRRDSDGGDGDHDNGVWFELGFPLWKAKEQETLAQRVKSLEARLAYLESSNPQPALADPSTGD